MLGAVRKGLGLCGLRVSDSQPFPPQGAAAVPSPLHQGLWELTHWVILLSPSLRALGAAEGRGWQVMNGSSCAWGV